MMDLTIVYWRNIPAQLLVGRGRKALKFKLSEKFEKTIDRCAMKVGAKNSESYLQDWHKKTVPFLNSDTNTIELEAARLEQYYSTEKLKVLVLNNGWD